MVQVVVVSPCLVAPCCSLDCSKVVFPLDDDDDDDDFLAHCGCGFGYGCGCCSGFGSGVVALVLVPSPYLCYALFSAQPLSRSLAPLLSLPALAHVYPIPQNTLQIVSQSAAAAAARMPSLHLPHVLPLHHVLFFLALDPVLVPLSEVLTSTGP